MSEPAKDPAIYIALLSLFGNSLHSDFMYKGGISHQIKEVDAQIDTIADRLLRFQSDATTRMTQLRRQRNFLAPINRLHVEILNQIFLEAMTVHPEPWYDDDTYYVRLFRLSSVCSFWSGVIAGQAVLWTRLDPISHPSLVSMALERSKEMPLKVGSRPSASHESKQWDRTKRFLATSMSSVGRWSEASHIVINDADDLWPLNTTAAPLIRSVNLSCRYSLLGRKFDLFQGYAPLLDEVQITGFTPEWTSNILTGLRSLALSAMPIPFAHLENILRACPRLSSLTLTSVNLLDRQLSTAGDTPIFLPSLVRLAVAGLPQTSAAHFFSRFAFHHLQQVVFSPTGLHYMSDSDMLDAIFSALAPEWESALGEAIPESAVLSLNYQDLDFYTVPPAISVTLSGFRVGDILHRFTQRMGTLVQPICDTIILNFTEFNLEAIRSILHRLDAFPFLRHLHFRGHSDARVFTELAEPYIGADNTFSWHLPNLRIITCYERDVRSFLHMAQKRSRVRNTSSASSQG